MWIRIHIVGETGSGLGETSWIWIRMENAVPDLDQWAKNAKKF